MNKSITYLKIHPCDYKILTKIMTVAFNEDTSLHTDIKEDGPTGYNDGSLIKKLNENSEFNSYKIIYEDEIVGAYSVSTEDKNKYILEILFIDPKYRKKHLGSIAWKDIEKKYINAEKWIVETPAYSKRNYYFYIEKCGFKFKRKNICKNGAESFVFEKEIRMKSNSDKVQYKKHSRR